MVPVSTPVQRLSNAAFKNVPHAQRDLTGLLVMLVENNRGVAQAISHLIESARGEVLLAESGEEALEMISEIDLLPDVFLLDYQLGHGMDGVQLYKAVLSKYGRVPTAIVSANRTAELRSKCRELNLKLLPKPVNAKQVYDFLASELRA